MAYIEHPACISRASLASQKAYSRRGQSEHSPAELQLSNQQRWSLCCWETLILDELRMLSRPCQDESIGITRCVVDWAYAKLL